MEDQSEMGMKLEVESPFHSKLTQNLERTFRSEQSLNTSWLFFWRSFDHEWLTTASSVPINQYFAEICWKFKKRERGKKKRLQILFKCSGKKKSVFFFPFSEGAVQLFKVLKWLRLVPLLKYVEF